MNILDIAIAKKLAGGGGGSGTDNYNDLSNLPKINDTTLSGNKSSSALGLQSEINSDSKLASDLVDDTNQDNKFVTSTEKNTWNGKQNAIDADHKLSSSLVSFSTAEAAALASGIDGTKVGQISTNQTNILSVEDMICDTEFSTSTAYAVGDYVTYNNSLYEFTSAHSAGAWNSADVTQINVVGIIGNINTVLEGVL